MPLVVLNNDLKKKKNKKFSSSESDAFFFPSLHLHHLFTVDIRRVNYNFKVNKNKY